MKNSFLSEKLEFEIDGSILTENQIKSIIPNDLKNKEDFISFYMAHNGIYFHDFIILKLSSYSNKFKSFLLADCSALKPVIQTAFPFKALVNGATFRI